MIQNYKFGQQLAKRTQERTCGTRIAGLRGAKLRPAGRCATDFAAAFLLFRLGQQPAECMHGLFKAEIQNS